MEKFLKILESLSGTAIAVLIVAVVYLIAQRLLLSRTNSESRYLTLRRILLFVIGIIGLLVILMVIPISNELRGQIISFVGIILSAGLALSSTTLLGNALAAVMMRVTNHFKVGDFIRTDDCFGRVIKRGVFHTEVQTETRDIRTIPNLTLSSNGMTVIRSKGTIISGEVSLGYDVSRSLIEESLLKAAKNAELQDPFVFVTALGDYSVNYKLHGVLEDTSSMISTQSRLYKSMLDQLHEDGIEIVSPTFMNQRQLKDKVFIPAKSKVAEAKKKKVEEIIFDKADLAKELQVLALEINELEEKIEELKVLDRKEGLNDYDVSKLEIFETMRDQMKENKKKDQDKLDKG